jgi:hypothetical protein
MTWCSMEVDKAFIAATWLQQRKGVTKWVSQCDVLFDPFCFMMRCSHAKCRLAMLTSQLSSWSLSVNLVFSDGSSPAKTVVQLSGSWHCRIGRVQVILADEMPNGKDSCASCGVIPVVRVSYFTCFMCFVRAAMSPVMQTRLPCAFWSDYPTRIRGLHCRDCTCITSSVDPGTQGSV